jgi:steroid delta-isomerase-like uncharacterized protein
MTQQDAASLLRENIEAFNAGDWSRFVATLANRGMFEDLPVQRRQTSRNEAADQFFQWKHSFPDVHGTVQEIVSSGDTAAARIMWEGTHRGDLVGPMGTLPATGKRAHISACIVVKAERGKIAESHHYFDLLTMLQQIGAVPQPAGTEM